MIAVKPPLVVKEIASHIIIGKNSDIPMDLEELKKLALCECTLQTTRDQDLENTHFLIYKNRGESTAYILNYNSSGKLMTYDRVSDWDNNSVLTIHPE